MISLTNYDFQWARSELVIIYPDRCSFIKRVPIKRSQPLLMGGNFHTVLWDSSNATFTIPNRGLLGIGYPWDDVLQTPNGWSMGWFFLIVYHISTVSRIWMHLVVAAPVSERFINHLVISSESLSPWVPTLFSSQQEPEEPQKKSRPKNHWLMKSRMGIIPLGGPTKFGGFMGSYHLVMMFLLNLQSWGFDGIIPFSRPKKSQESLVVHHIPMIFPHCIPMLYSDKC